MINNGYWVKIILDIVSSEELTWKNHQKSKKLFKTKFHKILQIFEEFNVKINLQQILAKAIEFFNL